MCVDKHNFKCCCGCSLTCGTITIGILQVIGAISYAIAAIGANSYAVVGNWVAFSFAAVLAVITLMVLIKPHDACIRKLIFYVYLVVAIRQLIAVLVVIIMMFVG